MRRGEGTDPRWREIRLMSHKIRVLIADQQAEFRAAVRRELGAQPDLEVVGEVAEGSAVVARAEALAPDVVVLDLAMPGAGLPALDRLAASCPETRAVVLAPYGDVRHLRLALAAGGLGYVLPRADLGELPAAVREVKAGRAYQPRPFGEVVGSAAPVQSLRARHQALSKREQEVLQAVAYGYTNRQIAESLGLSVKSIETYRYRVAEKLGFSDRVDLVRFALELGLLRTGKDGLPGSQPGIAEDARPAAG